MDAIAVLVVDDEESVRTYLADFLGSAGYQVRTSSAGPQALRMLSSGSFDAVLLDVVMPEMSGLEVLKQYRASGGTSPVIVLSALCGADDAVRVMKLGATDYLCKPFSNEELEASLGRAVGRTVELRGNGRSGTGAAEAFPSPRNGHGTNTLDGTAWAYPNPFNVPQPPPPPPKVPEEEMSLKDIGKRAAMLAEREAILAMLHRTAWNKRKAASKLKISYKALLYKIKESGINDPRSSAEL